MPRIAAASTPTGRARCPSRSRFEPDALTREVLDLVDSRFADHPGSLDAFAWPVTRAQALEALTCFVRERLPSFGRYQDAMWPGQPWLYHAHLSAALNLKLLDPREVVAAAVEACEFGKAPLAAVEGFVRQILGWREYVRGIYWTRMPDYLESNALAADADLPDFYWTGDTDMHCLADTIGQTLKFGYAHHIQRLMVTGLYALLLGVEPKQVHEWYLAVYVDAVEWVELPNTLGMSQFADGGLMASKPYAATGQYIDRMSGYCKGCRYDPKQRTGDSACPFTTLYWDFLMRHADRLREEPAHGPAGAQSGAPGRRRDARHSRALGGVAGEEFPCLNAGVRHSPRPRPRPGRCGLRPLGLEPDAAQRFRNATSAGIVCPGASSMSQ